MLERAFALAHALPHAWALMQALAIFAGALVVARAGRRERGRPPPNTLPTCLPGGGGRAGGVLVGYAAAVAAGACGGVMLGSAVAWARWIGRGAREAMPATAIGGMGALAALVFVWWRLARGTRDALAPAIGAMVLFARLGCFCGGCDFGAPSRVPWAMRYPPATPAFAAQRDAGLVARDAIATLPVHPTQLYEALVGVIVIVVACMVRPRRDGDRLRAAIATYAAGRLLVDVVRGDLAHAALGLTTTQWLAIATLALAARLT